MLAFILDTTRPKAKTILLKATQQAVFSQLICLLIFKVCKYIIVKFISDKLWLYLPVLYIYLWMNLCKFICVLAISLQKM